VVKKANEVYDLKAKEDPFFAKVLAHQRDFLKKYRAYKNFTQPDPDLMTVW
jgi:TRAP-type mannitol/chloroaromatic compound transport system substrate-binding protein